MPELKIRLVELQAYTVAAAHGFGPSPEGIAIEKLMRWAQAQGLLEDPDAHRFFGFNNPDPTPGSPNYGYEQWITVDVPIQGAPVHGDGETQIKQLPAGLYAVARCRGVESIYPTWQALVAWQEDNGYRMARRPCLEELLTPQAFFPGAGEPDFAALEFDLFHPVSKV